MLEELQSGQLDVYPKDGDEWAQKVSISSEGDSLCGDCKSCLTHILRTNKTEMKIQRQVSAPPTRQRPLSDEPDLSFDPG